MNFVKLPFLFVLFSRFQLSNSLLIGNIMQTKLQTVQCGGDEKFIFMTWHKVLTFRQLSVWVGFRTKLKT